MSKISGLRIKYANGTYSEEIPIKVSVGNVEWDNVNTLADILGQLDIADGTVKSQLDKIVSESKAAVQNGTTTSLVTTGEKYTWNNKVSDVTAGTGLSASSSGTTRTLKAKLNSETSAGTIGTTSKLYAVSVDSNGKLCVSVPWTDTTYTAATATPKMDSTGAVGTSVKYAREDHVHPSDTSRISTSLKGAANGVAQLDASGKVPSSQLPSYVDDVLEYNSMSDFPSTGETGKIYISKATNLTYRWSGTTYVEISPSLALGETSSTAYRGDRGKTAYTHATDSSRLTTAKSSGLYKISTTAEGHVAGATAVEKSDITSLGIPGSHQTIKQDGVTGATANRYATCSTAAATAAKTASVTAGTFNLEAGARVSVKFANANTASNPTLNINSKGAKNIFYKGTQITTGAEKELIADVVDFIYDGTQWNLVANGSAFKDITNAEIDQIITNVNPSDSGYITSSEIDEIVGNVGSTTLVYLLNSIYPVGSYYETSDSTFNPNNTFMGTWVLESSTNAVYRWHRTA